VNGNSDKHKPLSPEELFRLLETKNDGALSGEGLDDFETDALEGFSSHVSAEKARQLTEEVHARIHEKLREPEKKRPPGRIIWLSAAASVVIALIISAYVLVQQAKDPQELALNKEASEEMKNLPAAPAVQEPLTTVADQEQKQEVEKKPLMPPREAAVSDIQSSLQASDAITAGTTAYAGSDYNRSKNEAPVADVSLEMVKDESKKSQGKTANTYDARFAEVSEAEDQKAGYAVNGTVAVNKAQASPKEDMANTVPAQEKIQKQSPAVTYEGVVTKESVNQTLKKRKEKEADTDSDIQQYEVAPASRYATTEESKGPVGNTHAAYYVGGNQELKTRVTAWFKEHQQELPKGNYNIRVKVEADGTAEVLEVKAEKNAGEKMVKPLEESLRSLKGWKPGPGGEGTTGHEAAFTLSF
jgi:hypothetical protein